jgi:hypothetical protein
LAIKLELSTDKQVALYYDDDKKSDWYIKMEKGLKVRKASGTSDSYMVNSANIANKLLDSIKGQPDKASMLVATEPIEGDFYPIITSSATSGKISNKKDN